MRKERKFEVTDRIVIEYFTDSGPLKNAFSQTEEYICRETLADELRPALRAPVNGVELEVNGEKCIVELSRLGG